MIDIMITILFCVVFFVVVGFFASLNLFYLVGELQLHSNCFKKSSNR